VWPIRTIRGKRSTGGARYLRQLLDRYDNREDLALSAYNAGPGRMDDHLATGRPLPAETRAYVPKVLGGAERNPFDRFDPPEPTGPNPFDRFDPKPPEEKPSLGSTFVDSFKKGVQGVGEDFGTAWDVVAGNAAGKEYKPDDDASPYEVPIEEGGTDRRWWANFAGKLIPGSAPFLAGAATGAAAGSVVPGAGTMLGAMLGGGLAAAGQTLGNEYSAAREIRAEPRRGRRARHGGGRRPARSTPRRCRWRGSAC